jgi:hypothetical protein
MKIWTSNEKGDDKIIVYSNDMIYKANPPASEIDQYLFDLQLQHTPSKNYFGIPLRYIAEINQQEGKNYIEIIFRGDSEHLKIKDDKTRSEIFEFFKQNIPGATTSIVRQSTLQSVKKQLIAMAVISIIFSWSLYLAKGIEEGNDYDVTGQRYHSIAGIVLLIASMGVKKILVIFSLLLLIAGIRLTRNYKNPVVKNTLRLKH